MYGQMTAGSWIYIGSQGIVQGTYETFAEAGRQHYGGKLDGRWILTGGLGGMGGAQPLAATMAGASMLAVECNPSRIRMRLDTGYLDQQADTLDRALAIIQEAHAGGRAVSVGLLGNAAEVFPELVRRVQSGDRRARPDMVTDQTSAHDPLNGYLPSGWSLEEAETRRAGGSGRRGESREGVDGGASARDARLSSKWACRRSTTATTCGRWLWRPASAVRSISPALCPLTSARCSAAASGRSAGWRCRESPRTSTGPTPS
jgi:hypothetical protein